MDKNRRMELLMYAKECFQHCTNPFESRHLRIKHVTADECIDLSHDIANILAWEVLGEIGSKRAEVLEIKQKAVFLESQKET